MSTTRLRIAEAVSDHVIELNQTRLVDMVAGFADYKRANDELRLLTGLRTFFRSPDEFREFRQLVMSPIELPDSQTRREWGDFQTPPHLAAKVCSYLVEEAVSPTVVIEPTYGTGNFILAALNAFPRMERLYGVELQERYEWHLKIVLLIRALLGRHASAEVELHQDDIFTHVFPERVAQAQHLLILGNPPWVTNSELGALGSGNLPEKQNIKAYQGMDALTGKSNFDISEFILLRLLDLFAACPGTLAMLCKNSTAKNIIEILPRKGYPLSNLRMLEMDAGRDFGVAVDACLFVADLGASQPVHTCQVATLDNPKQVHRTFGWIGSRFVSSLRDYESVGDLDGKSALIWRQGLKHDCARIMELALKGEVLINGSGEAVDVEAEYVYWLLKSSDLRGFEVGRPRKKVIVTQRHLGEDTSHLMHDAPQLWEYLLRNRRDFERRKSNIYRNKPRFSIFGIGEYSFKPYKVAISGLYKEPNFTLVCPIDHRPVMLDDTCYFLGFDTYLEALLTASLLNSPSVRQFLHAIAFKDSKRPYTKEVLMRIHVTRVASRLSLRALSAFWENIGYRPKTAVTESDLEWYKRALAEPSQTHRDAQLDLKM